MSMKLIDFLKGAEFDGLYNDQCNCVCEFGGFDDDQDGFAECGDYKYDCKLGYKHDCDCEETDHSECELIILPTKDTSHSDIPYEI